MSPAVMRLTGRATWCAPPMLRRVHARFGISEGGEIDAPGESLDGPASDRRDSEPATAG